MLFSSLSVEFAQWLVQKFIRWRAGPETEESRGLLARIESDRAAIAQLQEEISQLERRRLESRTAARKATPSWWKNNREALLVNVVAGLIVSVPLLIIGIVIGLLID